MEKLEKYLPWIAGVVALIVVYYLYNSGAFSSSGSSGGVSYATTTPTDTSGATAAAAQANSETLQAQTSAFHDIAAIIGNNFSAEYALQSQNNTNATNLAIANANNATQQQANFQAASVAKTNSRNNLWGSVVNSAAGAYTMFLAFA
jgi:hypothetical protein